MSPLFPVSQRQFMNAVAVEAGASAEIFQSHLCENGGCGAFAHGEGSTCLLAQCTFAKNSVSRSGAKVDVLEQDGGKILEGVEKSSPHSGDRSQQIPTHHSSVLENMKRVE